MAKQRTPSEAIRAKCLDCMCGNYREVDLCSIPDCPLYPFRPIKGSLPKNEKDEETSGGTITPAEEIVE